MTVGIACTFGPCPVIWTVGSSNWKGFSVKPIFSRTNLLSAQSAPHNVQAGRTHEALDTSADQLALFQETREQAIAYGDDLLRIMAADLRQGARTQLAALWEYLPYYIDVVATAQFAIQQATAPTPAQTPERAPTM